MKIFIALVLLGLSAVPASEPAEKHHSAADSAEARQIDEAPDVAGFLTVLRVLVDSVEADLKAGGKERVHTLPDRIAAVAKKVAKVGGMEPESRKLLLKRLDSMQWTADKMHEYADSDRPEAALRGVGKLRKHLYSLTR